MQVTRAYRITTHLMLLGATFFWGINPMLMKVGFRELSPIHFNLFRLILGLIITLPFVLLKGLWKPLRKEDLPGLVIVSVFGFFLFQITYSYGVDYTSASVTAIILGLLPITVIIINRLRGNRDLTKLKIIGVGGTLVGILCIAAGRKGGLSLGDTYLGGVLLLVIAEFSYGAYTVFVKPLTRYYSVSQIIVIVLFVSASLFFFFSIPSLKNVSPASISPVTYASAAASGFLALSLGNILWSAGVKRIGSLNPSVYGNLPPLFGLAAGMLILGERLSLLQILGAVFILSGVFLVNSRRAQKDTS